MKKRVVLFGEMLWDCLRTGSIPGGAPMNVALNLHQLGHHSQLISSVGHDKLGSDLLEFLHSFCKDTSLIQTLPNLETSRVLIDDSDPENIRYDILENVAWDHIKITTEAMEAVKKSDTLIFGSLAVRSAESFKTLLAILPHAKWKIFDANLRPPYVDFDKITTLLAQTDLLKINEDELVEFAKYFEISKEIKPFCDHISKEFEIEKICITLGSKGALIYDRGKIFQHAGYQVKVSDTIGAGDAFLSGFIYRILDGKEPIKALDFGCKLGAYVATQKGGTPKYSLRIIEEFDPRSN
ncbi:carbohydrate kinase family protein [Algoriphagus sediminis]|uniref:PfkB family carbohydrate kinase n=1 Tax=Algoriphagus sediminis TaxID=3057113 RepID=A0ABT7YAP8_9BACT|nr:PfkB family carbohydrate kinase [Algoriphagus sediminis]MDN3203516.1 PfkB family carbohydrate kinase [Algoriphagus sediminis]